MADITSRGQGEVENTGKVNWRGDQTTLPQGGHAYNKSSTIPLDQLGGRKVVGDRVFRYARAAGAITKGDLMQMRSIVTGETLVPSASSDTGVVGSKVFALYSTTSLTKDELAEGMFWVQTGSAPGNTFRIRGNDVNAGATAANVYLYDEITAAFGATSAVSVIRNMYSGVAQYDTGGIPLGVAPITCTTNDYFWVQTWGPVALKYSAGAGVKGYCVVGGKTGSVQDVPGGTGEYLQIGTPMQVGTGAQHNLTFITLAP